ncbi:methylosome subunit pICln-like [Haliotis cracherodii]|uniref:methylosome subunit pICln-like n=1 Tax=Haliotis cracherodii TaxID=6455 RepID=UPI0039E9B376
MVILTSFPPPTEGIRHKQENTVANIDGSTLGNGTLYVAESRLSWMGENGRGFSLEYPAISLHAVSRDTSSFPQECLYLMVEGKLSGEAQDGSSEGEEEDDPPIGEVRFVPSDRGTLDAMFLAMNDCQALHPDPQDSDSEADGDEDFFTGEEGEGQLTEQGEATLQHLDNLLQVGQGDGAEGQQNGHHRGGGGGVGEENMELGQFEDADMEQ